MAQHPLFPLPLPNHAGGLLLTPCPGTLQAGLEQSLQQLQGAGATAVVTLMTEAELHQHQVGRLAQLCRSAGLQWFHLPVDDEGTPEDRFAGEWTVVGPQLHQRLDQGEWIAIHCKGGSGRTGILAAQILIERGVQVLQAVQQVKALRPNAFIHAVQRDYIEQFATAR